jgi:uncharacterized membrane protein (UPF0127 family)
MLRPAYSLALLVLASCGSSEGQIQARETALAESSSAETAYRAEAGQERLPPPRQAWVIFGTDTVHAEVARTFEERERGLMYRETLEKGRGMFFVFPDAQIRSFWMKNTFIPLDIAYLDAELRIVDIQAMEAETLDPHPSAQPAMFALEVPLGWFQEVGILVGAQAQVVFGPG